jgi:malonyl CoA-acyl carrier protein transacylase
VDKVQEAKNIITELTKFYHTSVTHPGQIHAEIFVPQTMYNYIIGARGSEIKQIQNNFKVSVYIPNVDSVTKSVVVVGEPEGVKAAEKHIHKIIDQANADREAAEKMADSWVDGGDEVAQESHSTARSHQTDESATPLSSLGFKSGAASAIAAASASAWGASILSSADGW